MELAPYLDGLRRDLVAAAAAGGPDVARAADLLGGSLEASARLCLLEALADAAAEITMRLTNASVEVRLHGRDAQLVVLEAEPPPIEVAAELADPTEPGYPFGSVGPGGGAARQEPDSGDIARITLRLPEGLKEAVERAAAAEGMSANAWLVRAIAQVIAGQASGQRLGREPRPEPPGHVGRGRRITGFAQA